MEVTTDHYVAAGLSGVIIITRSHNSKEMTTKAAGKREDVCLLFDKLIVGSLFLFCWTTNRTSASIRDEDDHDHNRNGGDGNDNVNAMTVETVAATTTTKGPRAAAAMTKQQRQLQLQQRQWKRG
ncbi:hypothetical protein EDB85DRAFT_1903816 [Lactarius pseudohatsudake]|nr:hypothetical protein EDB85DRAFT_1903816 [Lactarius pseudohatsudake]